MQKFAAGETPAEGNKVVRVGHDSNSETDISDSSRPNTPSPIKIDMGRSLTVEQFITQLEKQSKRTVKKVLFHYGRRHYPMPVKRPGKGEPDRFLGHGSQILEDVAYQPTGKVRTPNNVFLIFMVFYVGFDEGHDVYYKF